MGAMDPEGNSSNDLGGDLKLEQMATDSATYADMLQYTRGASINYLPVELLLLIFKVLAEEHPDSLCSLLRVNKQWHSILSSEHVAWQNLVMNDAEFGDGSTLRGMAKMWFRRADPLPVDVNLQTRRRDSMIPIMSYLLPNVHRWGNVTFFERRMHFRFAQRATPSHDSPSPQESLESVLVTIQPRKSVSSDLEVPLSHVGSPSVASFEPKPYKTVNFQDNSSYLKELFVLGVRSLPQPEMVAPFMTVTSLTLVNHSTEIDFPTHQAIPFLSAFPALENLRFSNHNELAMVLDPEYRADCHQVMPALLPRLHYLAVMGICSSRCILTHLALPKMTVLHLIHINSSTEYDHPRMSDPGDSDDEANDFSRSPWTDHATGMGLRNLFRHGIPPLRELIMDYADLRTKDFKWLFERMPELELFYIVASDLSDNVVGALSVSEDAPESEECAHEESSANVTGLWNTDNLAHYMQRRRHSRQILLPRLTRLKLTKCQKTSGDAVVQMVRSRVRAASEGRIAMLTELSLVECSQVTETHHLQLQALVPSIPNLIYVPGFEE